MFVFDIYNRLEKTLKNLKINKKMLIEQLNSSNNKMIISCRLNLLQSKTPFNVYILIY